ncbi:MAG: cellulase family glycosylhydrolase [Lachnospiraceae bacterium]|nr:cellulase family glycosylhydrolase [Lachnospiraceae bacterium]
MKTKLKLRLVTAFLLIFVMSFSCLTGCKSKSAVSEKSTVTAEKNTSKNSSKGVVKHNTTRNSNANNKTSEENNAGTTTATRKVANKTTAQRTVNRAATITTASAETQQTAMSNQTTSKTPSVKPENKPAVKPAKKPANKPAKKPDYKNMSALEVTKYLGNGINLGNTFEAYGHSTLGTSTNVSAYETCWGQPVTTKEMISGMKAAGFDSIRIPIAWTNMMNFESGDYTINQAYINRIKEVVNWALDSDMFVIINDHWDGGWWSMFGSVDQEKRQKAWTMYESLWTQLSNEFGNYSEKLIFESGNEELGDRLNESTDFSKFGTLTEDEKYETTNAINQKFVDIVRKSGKNNDHRFLLLAGYNTDIDKTVDERFKMPKDSANSKLFVSVHYYSPWNYCGTDHNARWGTKSDYTDMNTALKKLQRFTNEGYGVIIGEFAAIPYYDKEKNISVMKNNTVEFTNNFLDNCDVYNYCPMLWSTNDSYNKNTNKMIDPSLAELFTSRNYASEKSSGASYLPNVKSRMEANLNKAPEKWDDVEDYNPGDSVAWIMWMGGAGTYSTGDTFNPSDNTAGIKASNAVVTGPGEYSVSLDFANGNSGVTFSALGIKDAEIKYPGCIINIKEITIDGQAQDLSKVGYTTSDDGKCTRVNLMNEWVGQLPTNARTINGDLTNASAVILDKTKINNIHNITVKFEFVVK